MVLPSRAVNVTAALENLTKRSPPWMLSCAELNYMETKGLGEDYFFPRDSPVPRSGLCTAHGALSPRERASQVRHSWSGVQPEFCKVSGETGRERVSY